MPDQATDSQLLRAVVDTAVDGVIVIDADGVIRMFNPACERLFGYRADEVQDRNVKILMPPPYRDEHDGYLDSYRRTGQAKIIGIGREVLGRRKDGSTFPMDLSVGEAKLDGAPMFVGIIHDLTERKHHEEALREAADQLRAVVDTAVDGVILIDSRGDIVMCNPACERLFGYAASEVVGRNVRMLMPTPFADEHDTYLDNYRLSGVAKIIGIGREVLGLRKDGSTFPVDLSVGETRHKGDPMFVGILRDLSERKRTYEQLAQAQKMEVVGQLSGGIAHDFNNLLTVIMGNADTLLTRLKARPDLARSVEMILAAGGRGAELTRRLLAFGRRQLLEPATIDCNALVEGMRQLLQRTLREDVHIDTDTEPELWRAYADPGQLESALLNLSLNAQDAMPDGGHLTIATANVPLDERYCDENPEVPVGRYVMISVTDDGHGMAPEVRERVFEPFFTTKEVGRGSGLGLSMVYGFAKQSGGHITLYSELGLGTTVRIYLPIADGSEPSAPSVAPEEPYNTSTNATVLVAEDDPFVRAYAIGCLEGLGYQVVPAANGREALVKLAECAEIDVLFTDIVMPGGMNGVELARHAHQLRPTIRVLFTSGYAIETLAANGRLPSGAAILHKPYRQAELARRLVEVLEAAHGEPSAG